MTSLRNSSINKQAYRVTMSVTVHGVSVSLGSEADDDNNARKQDHDATLMVRE